MPGLWVSVDGFHWHILKMFYFVWHLKTEKINLLVLSGGQTKLHCDFDLFFPYLTVCTPVLINPYWANVSSLATCCYQDFVILKRWYWPPVLLRLQPVPLLFFAASVFIEFPLLFCHCTEWEWQCKSLIPAVHGHCKGDMSLGGIMGKKRKVGGGGGGGGRTVKEAATRKDGTLISWWLINVQ